MTVKKKQTKSKGKRKSKPKSPEEQMKAYYKMMAEAGQIDKPPRKNQRKHHYYDDYIRSFEGKEYQTIHKTSYAPLGRPPTEKGSKEKYDEAKRKPTQYRHSKARYVRWE